MNAQTYRWLANICFPLGFVSSIAVWIIQGGTGGDPAHFDRFGIFVGLWAPTFFILTDRFERTANRMTINPTPVAAR
jgi:hypothetical protein